MIFNGFDWDNGNLEKCQKHGVTIEELESLFLKEPWIAPDIKHSIDEHRFFAVGVSQTGRYIFAVFTFRTKGQDLFIRPISARYMHEKEVRKYNEHRQGKET